MWSVPPQPAWWYVHQRSPGSSGTDSAAIVASSPAWAATAASTAAVRSPSDSLEYGYDWEMFEVTGASTSGAGAGGAAHVLTGRGASIARVPGVRAAPLARSPKHARKRTQPSGRRLPERLAPGARGAACLTAACAC